MRNRSAPRRLLLVNNCSPGDVLMLTAAVRDLHKAHPGQYVTGVETECPDLWLNNPYVTALDPASPGIRRIDCQHPRMLDRCNHRPGHYIESVHNLLSRKLRRPVPLTRFAPDVHLTAKEKERPPHGLSRRYWAMVAGANDSRDGHVTCSP